MSKDPDEIADCSCTDPAELKIERAQAALHRYEDRNSKPNPAHLADAVRGLLSLFEQSAYASGVRHAAAVLAEKKGWTPQGALDYLGITDVTEPRGEPFDAQDLLAEADALVESWDRKGSWSSDSPVGMVMRLGRALRAVGGVR